MGLYVSTMKELPTGDRSLYVYLLDYGWPAGDYERIFRENFGHLSQRASETEAVVVMSGRGVHFANEVLDWHHVCGHEATEILPAILITHTHPRFFMAGGQDSSEGDLRDLALLPLRSFCTSPSDFLQVIGSIFDDLEKGLTLRNFRAEKFDVLSKNPWGEDLKGRVSDAIMLQPNFAGIGLDLKKLFGKREQRSAIGE